MNFYYKIKVMLILEQICFVDLLWRSVTQHKKRDAQSESGTFLMLPAINLTGMDSNKHDTSADFL